MFMTATKINLHLDIFESLIKRKLFWLRYPELKLTYICRNIKFGGWVEFDELKRLRREEKKKKG